MTQKFPQTFHGFYLSLFLSLSSQISSLVTFKSISDVNISAVFVNYVHFVFINNVYDDEDGRKCLLLKYSLISFQNVPCFRTREAGKIEYEDL